MIICREAPKKLSVYHAEEKMSGVQDEWVLIFSDGTGQRGVRADEVQELEGEKIKNTNIFQMYSAIDGQPGIKTFYDAGLGAPEKGEWDWTRTCRNLWSKATGWGITANIVDCYEALMKDWRPGARIGLFGFSRGAYTVRCLGGVLAVCGVAATDRGAPISSDKTGAGAERRRAIAQEAVAAYKIKDEHERRKAGDAFAARYASEEVVPSVVGVFDTVKALGLPGMMNTINPYKHEFHNSELSTRVPVGLQALSIDENRKAFAPELWDDAGGKGKAAGQIIEQIWFPGVHSDIGGGYEDDTLANLSLAWMLERLRVLTGLHFPIVVNTEGKVLGPAHDERTGFGQFWLPAARSIRGLAKDTDPLCVDIEKRFAQFSPEYRPKPLRIHPRVRHFYPEKPRPSGLFRAFFRTAC
jgi:hypothetical protein